MGAMDDDFSIGGPDDGPTSSRAASGASTAAPNNKSGTATMCAACGQKEAIKKHRFCDTHKRAFDTMRWQARKANEEAQFLKVMSNTPKMQAAILDFCKDAKGNHKWARRTKIDWAQWVQSYGTRFVKRESDREKPFTRAAFLLYGQNKQGWSAAEADEEWEKQVNDPNVDRDTLGRNNELRIWYNVGPRYRHATLSDVVRARFSCTHCRFAARHARVARLAKPRARTLGRRSKDQETYVDTSAVTGTKQQRNVSEVDIAGMQQASKTAASFRDAHFGCPSKRGRAEAVAAASADEDEEEMDEVAEVLVESKKPKKDLASMCNKATANSERRTNKIIRDFAAAILLGDTLMQDLDKSDSAHETAVLKQYRATVEQRLKAAIMWMGSEAPAEIRSAFAKDANAAATETPEDDRTQSLKDYLETLRVRPVSDVSDMMALGDLRSCIPTMQACLTEAELDKEVQKYKNTDAACAQLLFAVKKSIGDTRGHLQTVAREAQRENKRKDLQKAKEQQEALKAAAKTQAEQVKKGLAKKIAPVIFTLPVDCMEGVATFTEEDDFLKVVRSETPVACMLVESKRVRDFLTMPVIAEVVMKFAGQYLQTSGAKTDGRCHAPLTPNTGKAETEQFFSQFLPDLLDVSGVKSAANFHSSSWLWGIVPNTDWVGATPNYAGVLRVVAEGELQQIAVNRSAVARLLGSKTLNLTMDSVADHVRNMSKEQARELKEAGFALQACIQQKNSILFIPAGWMVCERGVNHGVHCGVRKSFFTQSEHDAKSYETVVSALGQTPGRSVAVYEEILTALKNAVRPTAASSG